jgi:hypothetical protein
MTAVPPVDQDRRSVTSLCKTYTAENKFAVLATFLVCCFVQDRQWARLIWSALLHADEVRPAGWRQQIASTSLARSELPPPPQQQQQQWAQ